MPIGNGISTGAIVVVVAAAAAANSKRNASPPIFDELFDELVRSCDNLGEVITVTGLVIEAPSITSSNSGSGGGGGGSSGDGDDDDEEGAVTVSVTVTVSVSVAVAVVAAAAMSARKASGDRYHNVAPRVLGGASDIARSGRSSGQTLPKSASITQGKYCDSRGVVFCATGFPRADNIELALSLSS